VGMILSILVNAAALFVAAKIIPGIAVADLGTLLLAALIFGVVNTFVRPLVKLLSLPITILTLGLFHFVVNAGLLGLTAWLTPGFSINGFWAALFGAIVVSLVGMFLGGLIDRD
jgi:putative membrane protein